MTKDIRIENLKVSFGRHASSVEGVNDISLTCISGKKTGIVGESGSGKSLLAMSILQLLPPKARVEGRCLYKGQDLYRVDKKSIGTIRGGEIGLIPQNPFQSLNPVLPIGWQLLEGMRCHSVCTKKEAIKRICEGLSDFGFESPQKILKTYPFQLSGGMNQRILTVMGLLCRPSWIIADEPTKGLDAVLRKSIYQELEMIASKYTKSILLITHDLLFAKKFCDYIAVFYKGQMLEWGSSEVIFSHPKHPYTKALLSSMPHKGMKPIQLIENTGLDNKSYCVFYGFCPMSTCSCKKNQPLRTLKDGTQVRCCQYD